MAGRRGQSVVLRGNRDPKKLILAAADYGEYPNDCQPPPELVDYFTSKTWGLPREGGWEDQPAGRFPKMQAAGSVFEIMRGWKQSDDWSGWLRAVPERREIFNIVFKLRKDGR